MKKIVINDNDVPLTMTGVNWLAEYYGLPARISQKGNALSLRLSERMEVMMVAPLGEPREVRRQKIFHMINHLHTAKIERMRIQNPQDLDKLCNVVEHSIRKVYINVVMAVSRGTDANKAIEMCCHDEGFLENHQRAQVFLSWAATFTPKICEVGLRHAINEQIYEIDPMNPGKDVGIVADRVFELVIRAAVKEPSSIW